MSITARLLVLLKFDSNLTELSEKFITQVILLDTCSREAFVISNTQRFARTNSK